MQCKATNIIVKLNLFLLFIFFQINDSVLAEQRKYIVGVVPQFESSRTAIIWQPILERINKIAGVSLQFEASPSIPAFEKQFEAGEFDFAYMNPYHLIVANEQAGYLPLVHDVERKLFGIIVVKKDSAYQSVKELDGKNVAFPAPNALGAALLPRSEFDKKFNINVNELYVKSHSSVYLNVLLGQADAGGGVQKTLSQQSKEIQNQLRVLYQTTKVPSHPFVAHPRIDENIRNKITEAFLQLGNNETGRRLLEKIPIKRIGITALEDYSALRNMGLAEFYVRQ